MYVLICMVIRFENFKNPEVVAIKKQKKYIF